VDAHRQSVRCVLSRIVPIGLAGLLCACTGEPPTLHAPQDAQQAALGKLLLFQYQCGSCHVIAGVAAARGTLGPTLQAFNRRSYIAGTLPNQPATLVRWLLNPQALVPATTMPSMGVSAPDARAMAAYLLTSH
jgi:cytochrome c2